MRTRARALARSARPPQVRRTGHRGLVHEGEPRAEKPPAGVGRPPGRAPRPRRQRRRAVGAAVGPGRDRGRRRGPAHAREPAACARSGGGRSAAASPAISIAGTRAYTGTVRRHRRLPGGVDPPPGASSGARASARPIAATTDRRTGPSPRRPWTGGARLHRRARAGAAGRPDAATGTRAVALDLARDCGAPRPSTASARRRSWSAGCVIVSAGGRGAQPGRRSTRATGKRRVVRRAREDVRLRAPRSQATLGGGPQVVVVAGDMVFGVRPEDGALLWSHPTGWPARRRASRRRSCCPATACWCRAGPSRSCCRSRRPAGSWRRAELWRRRASRAASARPCSTTGTSSA